MGELNQDLWNNLHCDAIRWNIFRGDVVLESFNNILDQIHTKQICLGIHYDDFNFK